MAHTHSSAACGERPTTFMIRNLPRGFAAWDIVAELKLYTTPAAFDLVYVPWDRKGLHNVGFAFVNFFDPAHASKVQASMDGAAWRTGSRSRPVRVTPAHVQGFSANFQRFVDQGDAIDPGHAPLLFVGGEPASLEEVLRKPLRPEASCSGSTVTTCSVEEGLASAGVWTSAGSDRPAQEWCSEGSEEVPRSAQPARPPPGLLAPAFRAPPGLELPNPRRSPGYAACQQEVCHLLQSLLVAQGARALA